MRGHGRAAMKAIHLLRHMLYGAGTLLRNAAWVKRCAARSALTAFLAVPDAQGPRAKDLTP